MILLSSERLRHSLGLLGWQGCGHTVSSARAAQLQRQLTVWPQAQMPGRVPAPQTQAQPLPPPSPVTTNDGSAALGWLTAARASRRHRDDAAAMAPAVEDVPRARDPTSTRPPSDETPPRAHCFFFLSPPDIALTMSSMTEYTSTKPIATAAPIFCSSVSALPVTAAI